MFRNIVSATDGSEHADRALGYAVRLADEEGADLHVVHVTATLTGPRVAGTEAYADEKETVSAIQAQAAAIPIEHGLKTTIDISAAHAGGVADRIAGVARNREADLIVVGTRGHSAIAGALLGSVTQRLLHVAPCPVLAVPPPSRASESRGSIRATAVAD
jgi:nucleotide-binding universal stress UspA family protein